MVGLTAHDRPSPVELLYQHDLCQLVGEGLRSQRDSTVRGCDNRRRKPISPPDRKNRASDSVHAPCIEQSRPALGDQRLGLRRKRYQPVTRSDRGDLEQPLTFFLEPLGASFL